MKFEVKNLGPIKNAAIELAGLTVVCGKNNCGKTYLAYTLDTFLDTIDYNLRLSLHDSVIESIFSKGAVVVDLQDYIVDYIKLVQDTVPDFTKTLPRFLAMEESRFEDTEVKVPLAQDDVRACLVNGGAASGITIRITNTASIVLKKSPYSTKLTISLINMSSELPSKRIVRDVVSAHVAKMFNSSSETPLFPKSFIITSERTGAALFRSELLSVKVRNDQDKAKTLPTTGFKGYGYQRPVEKDIEFVLELKRFLPQNSYIYNSHPEVLDFLSTIAGGTYVFDDSVDQVLFNPIGTGVSLSLAESSSTVRALAELYFYLRHRVRRGQMLMFDEPEINLHPENQRKLARLFAMLVRSGIRVFITTHSDYIVREMNALIRLNNVPGEMRKLLYKKHGYAEYEGLHPQEVRCYVLRDGITEEVLFDVETRSFGIPSFDDTIERFNSLYNDLVDCEA